MQEFRCPLCHELITRDSSDPNKFNKEVFEHAKICPENKDINFDLDDYERGNVC